MKISQIIIRKAAKNVASPIGISVRTYVFRNSNARVIGIQKENRIDDSSRSLVIKVTLTEN